MTAPAAAHRPVLYLVPGGGRGPTARRAHPSGRRGTTLPVVSGELAARVLGTVFTPVARRVAQRLNDRVPLLARRGRPEPWAAAIAYLLAEEARLFEYDWHTTRTSFARELGTSLPTLRRRADAIRAALDPLLLDLPDPDPDLA